MCATSITCGNPEYIALPLDEVLEARMRKESAAAARLSSILDEHGSAPARKRAQAREAAAPTKAAA
jgi:hypothetical protein